MHSNVYVAVLLALVGATLAAGAAAQDLVRSVRTSTQGGMLTLDNGLLSVRFDPAGGKLTAASGQHAFLREGRLLRTGGKAALVPASGRLGQGQAIELTYPDGADRVALYPGVPFLCIQSRIAAPADAPRVVDRVSPAALSLALPKAPAELRVLGCDGLTPGDRERASYTFLAAADPATNAGVVAGWLTHDRASGIVFSRPVGEGLQVEGRSEYGALRLQPGGEAEGETLAVGYFPDARRGLEAYADAVAKVHAVRLPAQPSGYCTWYSKPYGGAADQEHLAELARFAGKELARFGFQVVQIDDKWQVSRRDFTAHNPRGPYPAGMKPTADAVRELGLTPGLWFIPFGWDPQRPLFRDHQDWFVHRPDGSLFEVKWAGTCLDMTHPGARELLRSTVSRITRDWGFRYLKIDGLWTGMATEILYPQPTYRDDKLGEAVFHDPAKTNLEAYRDGLELLREAAGPGVYVLGCNIAQNMRTLGGSFGLVDGMRVGRDIKADWANIVPCAEMGTRLYFFHNRVWHNDPDCLMLREPLTLDQARAWGSWIALTGQLNLVSEWLPGLPPERLDVIRRSMPNTGHTGRPVDLFQSPMPRVWQLTAGDGGMRRDVVGLFNWDDRQGQRVGVELSSLELPGEAGEEYVGFDYWADAFVPRFRGRLERELGPASCRVVSLRPAREYPQVVSTSRHVSQGIVDLVREEWQPASRTLSGTSRVVGEDPYELRIASPGGQWRVAAVELSEADRSAGVRAEVVDAGPNVRVRILAPVNREVRWGIRF